MRRFLGAFLVVIGLGACGGDDGGGEEKTSKGFPAAEAQAAVVTYRALAQAVYADSVAGAKGLKGAIDAFAAAPDAARHEAAKAAWLEARVPYNQNDVFRFYNGPIDNDPDGLEGLINAWPLDENFIDATRDEAQAGIINAPAAFPSIDEALIEGENTKGGEANVSSGYHAIEFLLWGQDDLEPGKGAGKRPHTDFVDGGTAANQARRRAYLQAAASLLVKHLEKVEAAWAPGKADNYAARFGQKPDEGSATGDATKDALANILRGMGSLAKAELSGERMTVAYKNRSQEDEHSCFSDNTWPDLHGNALGIQNAWLGQYKGAKLGPGLDAVVRAVDAALADQITKDLDEAVGKMKSLADGNASKPFDVVIAQPDGSPERTTMVEAIKALKRSADGLSQAAARLGLSVELEKPSEEFLAVHPRRFLPCSALCLLLLLGCGDEAQAPGPSPVDDAAEAFSGGAATVFDATHDAFARPAPGLTPEHEDAFFVGNSIFNRGWVTAPASVPDMDGLGPIYNAKNCSGCHFKDGRGRPPEGPDEAFLSMLIRLSVPGATAHGEPAPEPTYGGQLQGASILGVEAEGAARVRYDEVTGVYDDGTPWGLRRPTYSIEALAFGPMRPDVMLSPRVAPQMVGLGLLEAVPEATIVALADPDDADGDGISGRPNRVWDAAAGQVALGRFGWKANQPGLRQQVLGAFNGDMGITSSLFPADDCTEAQAACRAAKSGGSPELLPAFADAVVSYSATLAVPARRRWREPEVRRGQSLFGQLRCDGCHTPELRTGPSEAFPELAHQRIRPYTDLLLHDMGPELADGRPDFEATGSEWRTPPLWGVGLFKTVNRHTYYLHDGRARSLEEAVLWHGGEAQGSRDAFVRLPSADRAALLAFLGSL